ncbi:transglycosylase SLT domain-containing protein [Streptomyces sp. NPDC096079]|uniref:transglycosylase SLT domain-containing protein n=1 Tax=Streptomyces sp. NPDC096079 TaxID=3155820 RepID=UPI0033278B95
MATLSQGQIEMVARSAGLTPPATWAAVAMAESSGNTTARNPSSGAYGLWQIHPIHRKDHPSWTERWLSDPVNNARAAAVIYRQQGWGAWEAYTNGSYTKFLKGGGSTTQPADFDPSNPWDWLGGLGGPATPLLPDEYGGQDLGGDVLAVGEGIASVAEAVQKAGTWMSQPKNWLRVGYVWLGGFMVLTGAYIIASPLISKAAMSSPVGQTVKSVAKAAKRAPAKATARKATGGTTKESGA